MSPRSCESGIEDRGFPRVSGDEPDLTEIIEQADPFSPRERG